VTGGAGDTGGSTTLPPPPLPPPQAERTATSTAAQVVIGATRRSGERFEKLEGTATAAFFIERSPCNLEEDQSLKAE
jgi:hypothetical protein